MKDLLIQKPLSRPLLWLTGLLTIAAALPHWWNLHPLISASLLVFVSLRLLLWPTPQKPAPGWLMLLLLPATLALVLYHANWTEGRQFGVALLVVMAGMKLLEMKARRDLYVAVFLGYFVLVTLFLFYQSPLLTLYVLLVSTGFTALLIAVNLIDDALPWAMLLRRAGILVLTSIPVMILLFVLFPRLDGPLWSLNLGSSGVTGMSDNIRMGSISRLSQSSEVAFRVRFKGKPPPAAQRYWRGMVLWQTDGRNWEREDSALPAERFLPLVSPLDYEITMETSGQPWLFPLDHVLGPAPSLSLNTDGELNTGSPIDTRKTWQLSSSTAVRSSVLAGREWEMGLQLPDAISARTEQLAAQLRGRHRNDAEVVQAALRFFHDQPFIYTLEPPLLSGDPVDGFLFDTRRGFCEHYATSFVVLMRLADIPSRVVIGYQGGELNPLGGHLVIRQSDAHAWAEVWLDKRGWVRVDPTAAVAPERIEHSINNQAYATGAAVTFNLGDSPAFIAGMARRLKWFRDNLQLNWHYWVVGFNSARQQTLLQKLGLSRLQNYQLGVAAAVGAILLGSLAFFLGMRERRGRKDPVQQAYLKFRRKLEKSGLVISPSTGPQDLLKMAIAHSPQKAAEMQAIIQQYMALRYGRKPRKDVVGSLKSRIRKFRVSRHPGAGRDPGY
jgi:transglutaminase-like putative cysteine protease